MHIDSKCSVSLLLIMPHTSINKSEVVMPTSKVALCEAASTPIARHETMTQPEETKSVTAFLSLPYHIL